MTTLFNCQDGVLLACDDLLVVWEMDSLVMVDMAINPFKTVEYRRALMDSCQVCTVWFAL